MVNILRVSPYPRPGEITLKLNPKTTCLLVIDMQNGYAHDKGTFGKAGRDITLIKKTIAPITSAVEYCREKEIPIFYTQQIYVPEFFDAHMHAFTGRELTKGLAKAGATYVCMKGTWDVEILDELKPTEKDYIIQKNKATAFYHTWFEMYLRYLKIRTIIVTGCNTGYCVLHTVLDSWARDFDTIIIEEGVGDHDPYIQDALLELFDRRFGRVLSLKYVIKALEKFPEELKISGAK